LKFQQLKFIFLPPRSPVGGYGRAALAADVRECPLSYRTFADVDPPSKTSKQRIARLRKLGARTEVVNFAKNCDEFLPKFVAIHEARQKAKGYPAPFEADPLKARYLLALARDAHLLHVAAIWIDKRLVAATICLKDRSRIVLGMLAHEEEFESLSPAAVLIHELGALCANTEIRAIDLTPGGAYKGRFATGTEMAFTVELAWSAGGAVRLLIRRLARYGLGQIRRLSSTTGSASNAKNPP
jgi:CelD/BcsL family acetyltransferase involved in cellulose biosynthesis